MDAADESSPRGPDQASSTSKSEQIEKVEVGKQIGRELLEPDDDKGEDGKADPGIGNGGYSFAEV